MGAIKISQKKNRQQRINEAVGVLLLFIGIFTLISLLFFHPSDYSFYTSHPNESYRNMTGIIGAFLSQHLIFIFGWSSFSIPAVFLFWGSCFFLQRIPQKRWLELLGLLVALTSIASIFALIATPESKFNSGGALGYFIASHLETYFGMAGGISITFACLALSLLLATDFLLYPLFESALRLIQNWSQRILKFIPRQITISHAEKKEVAQKKVDNRFSTTFVPPKVKKYIPDSERPRMKQQEEKVRRSPITKQSEQEEALQFNATADKLKPKIKNPASANVWRAENDRPGSEADESSADITAKPHEKETFDQYVLPPHELLQAAQHAAVVSEDVLHRNSRLLEDTLRDFGLQVKVIEVEQGPVITRYELLPAPGVKVSNIVSLTNDLALALKTTSVRFLTPIPGKSAIGIEIPNSSSNSVFLKELVESSKLKKKNYTLPLLLGKDTSGKPLIADLAEMPHLLIAGATGSGKTVCLNAIIGGLLYTRSPDFLRFIMVDPKMVELAAYRDIPHMMTPVVTDVRKASATLNWLVSEMERRYKIFAAVGKRNIKAFNERKNDDEESSLPNDEKIPKKLPFIVLVIDELADLMLVSKDKVETAITRLAQLSRAVGIHLILATQRPSVDVITGVIKANFPARISFKVSSKVDSRTVLDANGADQLIGKGDMLFLEPGEAKPIRGQGTYVSDEEINATSEFIRKQKRAQYVPEIRDAMELKGSGRKFEKDELYEEAVQVVLEMRQASVSVLQRRLRLGYSRAARIIDMMEQEGIVGPPQGAKPREILVDQVENTSSGHAVEE
jgi:DNA segregation ATPase FtsK/SpoIIIE, S-DNA-T family